MRVSYLSSELIGGTSVRAWVYIGHDHWPMVKLEVIFFSFKLLWILRTNVLFCYRKHFSIDVSLEQLCRKNGKQNFIVADDNNDIEMQRRAYDFYYTTNSVCHANSTPHHTSSERLVLCGSVFFYSILLRYARSLRFPLLRKLLPLKPLPIKHLQMVTAHFPVPWFLDLDGPRYLMAFGSSLDEECWSEFITTVQLFARRNFYARRKHSLWLHAKEAKVFSLKLKRSFLFFEEQKWRWMMSHEPSAMKRVEWDIDERIFFGCLVFVWRIKVKLLEVTAHLSSNAEKVWIFSQMTCIGIY